MLTFTGWRLAPRRGSPFAVVLSVSLILLAAGVLSAVWAPTVSAQVYYTGGDPHIYVSGSPYYGTGMPVVNANGFVYPTYTVPTNTIYTVPTTTMYPVPTTVITTTTYVPPSDTVTVGNEQWISPGGAYCTLRDGGQVWVPNGASAAGYGC